MDCEAEQSSFGSGAKYQQEMQSVAGVSDNGFVAVGDESKNGTSTINGTQLTFITPSHVVVWRSTDGVNWTRNKVNDPTFASGDKTRTSVTPLGVQTGRGYYIVVGYAEKPENKKTSCRDVVELGGPQALGDARLRRGHRYRRRSGTRSRPRASTTRSWE